MFTHAELNPYGTRHVTSDWNAYIYRDLDKDACFHSWTNLLKVLMQCWRKPFFPLCLPDLDPPPPGPNHPPQPTLDVYYFAPSQTKYEDFAPTGDWDLFFRFVFVHGAPIWTVCFLVIVADLLEKRRESKDKTMCFATKPTGDVP